MQAIRCGAGLRDAVTAVGLLIALASGSAAAAAFELVNRTTIAAPAAPNGSIEGAPDLSEDGRFTVFASSASNLVEAGTSGCINIYLADSNLDALELISVTSTGASANSCSYNPQISADGRYVLFVSYATNLDPMAPSRGVFLRDRQAGTTRRIDTDSLGNPLYSLIGALSRDGRYAAVVHPGNGMVFRKELQPMSGAGLLEEVSVINDFLPVGLPMLNEDGTHGFGRAGLAISDDGRWIAWTSRAEVGPYGGIGAAGDIDGVEDIFLRDMQDNDRDSMVTLASRAADGSNPTEPACPARSGFECGLDFTWSGPLVSTSRWLSGDGQRLIFSTTAPLVSADTPRSNGSQVDGYLFDRSEGHSGVRLLTLPEDDVFNQRSFQAPVARGISSDGQRVLIDFNNPVQTSSEYLGEMAVLTPDTGVMRSVSRDRFGNPACCSFNQGAISGDGGRVAFVALTRATVDDRYFDPPDLILAGVDLFAHRLLSRPAGGSNVRAVADQSSSSRLAQVSQDGRFVLFESRANNLVADDDDAEGEYFVRDRQAQSTQRVAPPRPDEPFTDCRIWADMTPDARYVLYTTCEDETGDGGGSRYRVFRWDRQSNERILVSRASGFAGESANGSSITGEISDDGQRAVFYSVASNLDALGNSGRFHAYLRDIGAGVTVRLSNRQDGSEPDSGTELIKLAGDGQSIVLTTTAALTPEDTDNERDAYYLDLRGGSLRLLDPWPGSQSSIEGTSLSRDGRVALLSRFDQALGESQLWLVDTETGFARRADLRNDGSTFSQPYQGHLSDDARYVVFGAGSSDFLPGEGSRSGQVYVRDLVAGVTARVTVRADGSAASGFAEHPRLSPDGRWIVFSVVGDELLSEPGNAAVSNVLLTENPLFGGELVSDVDTLTPAADEPSFEASVSGDGNVVVFESLDPKLHLPCTRDGVPPQTALCGPLGETCPATGPIYVFALDVSLGCTDLVSVDNAGEVIKMVGLGKSGGDPVIGKPSTSAKGNLVAFVAPDAVVGKLLGETPKSAERRRKQGGFSVLLRNMLTGTTRRVAPGAGGTDPATQQPVGGARPQVAPDGRSVVYTGLRPSGKPAILQTRLDSAGAPIGTPLCVSCKSLGDASDPSTFVLDLDGFASNASVSANGSVVVYETLAKDAATGQCNNGQSNTSIVLRNMLTGRTRPVSQPRPGGGCLGNARKPRVDYSGTRVVFESEQPLVPGASGARPEVYLFDAGAGSLQQVSVDGLGGQVDAGSAEPTISGDGKLVVFTSKARSGFGADLSGQPEVNHVVVRELRRNTVRRLSKNPNGVDADGDSLRPSLNYTGDFVVFDSAATNLSAADGNGAISDVFLRVNPLVREVVFDSGFE